MNMTTHKPAPLIPQQVKRLCPVCGQASYSRDGIHPQCALTQADNSRSRKLRFEKEQKTKSDRPGQRSWEKKCPKCSAQLHVRRIVCDCGYVFGGR
jgi:ribosomal protein S27AE